MIFSTYHELTRQATVFRAGKVPFDLGVWEIAVPEVEFFRDHKAAYRRVGREFFRALLGASGVRPALVWETLMREVEDPHNNMGAWGIAVPYARDCAARAMDPFPLAGTVA